MRDQLVQPEHVDGRRRSAALVSRAADPCAKRRRLLQEAVGAEPDARAVQPERLFARFGRWRHEPHGRVVPVDVVAERAQQAERVVQLRRVDSHDATAGAVRRPRVGVLAHGRREVDRVAAPLAESERVAHDGEHVIVGPHGGPCP